MHPTLFYDNSITGNISLLLTLLLFVVAHYILLDIFQEKPKYINYLRINLYFGLFILSTFVFAFIINSLTISDLYSPSDLNVDIAIGIFLTLAVMGFFIYLKEVYREKE